MFKKYFLSIFILFSVPVLMAYAAPMLSIYGLGDGVSASVNVSNGDRTAPVILYYTNTNGSLQSSSIGTTDTNGAFSGTVNGSSLAIGQAQPVYVSVNGQQSLTSMWPYVSINNNNVNNIVFSPPSLSFSVGQTVTVNISGGVGGSYFISSNSDQSKVSANISGSVLTLSGFQSGASLITVCSMPLSTCGTLSVMVNGQMGTSGSPILSQSTVSLSQGQSGSVGLSGGVTPYTISSINGSGASASISGNVLNITANAVGTNIFNVCSSNGGGCRELSVSVVSQSLSPNPSLTFTMTIPYGNATKVLLSGGNGSYYLQSQSSVPVNASISGNTLTILGTGYGTGSVTICSTGTSCVSLYTSVVQATPPPLTGTGGGYFFETDLSIGMTGQDVTELQSRLRAEGYFTVAPTGYFGEITESAVRNYQSAHSISSVGVVGPQTRASLNQ